MTPARTRHVPSLRSMTGFGRAEVSAGPIAITVEARSLNHRHLDVTFRLPRALAGLERDARRVVQARLERGHVEIAVQLFPAAGASGQQVSGPGAGGGVPRAGAPARRGDRRLRRGDARLVLERPG